MKKILLLTTLFLSSANVYAACNPNLPVCQCAYPEMKNGIIGCSASYCGAEKCMPDGSCCPAANYCESTDNGKECCSEGQSCDSTKGCLASIKVPDWCSIDEVLGAFFYEGDEENEEIKPYMDCCLALGGSLSSGWATPSGDPEYFSKICGGNNLCKKMNAEWVVYQDFTAVYQNALVYDCGGTSYCQNKYGAGDWTIIAKYTHNGGEIRYGCGGTEYCKKTKGSDYSWVKKEGDLGTYYECSIE